MPDDVKTRVFFSYASEDAALVDGVYHKVSNTYADMAPWMDKYEIVAGDQLIDKITSGIDAADKFLVFLSARSIEKPWVQAELRKAVTQELAGKSAFVIPVKLGQISSYPAFLETKRYIDLQQLTESEWLLEIRAAVWGRAAEPSGSSEENLEVTIDVAADELSAAIVAFRPRFWAEDICFVVRTKVDVLERRMIFPGRSGMASIAMSELNEPRAYGIRITSEKIAPPHVFAMGLRFAPGTDAVKAVTSVERWDGSGASTSGISFMSFDG